MNGTRFIRLLTLAAAIFPCSGAEKIFDLSFDDYTVTPQIAKGEKNQTGFDSPDLQLRMFNGVNGQGNALNLGNSERLSYMMKGNFDPRQGTVILWVSPQNWNISDPDFQLFFYASQPKFNFRIAKTWENYITANLKYDIPFHGKKYFGAQVQARVRSEEWSKGRYHQIAVTWTGESMNLYIDGKKPEPTPIYIGNRNVPPTRESVRFAAPVKFPEAAGTITLGARPWSHNKKVKKEHSTAFDQVTVWNQALSPDQIRKEYEKIIPPKKNGTDNLLTIPKLQGNGKISGDLSNPVWRKAVRMPMFPIQSAPAGKLYALAWHDGKDLHVGFSSDMSCRKKNLTGHDDPLWNDDVFEFFIRTANKDMYHYLINGNGAIYDELNSRKTWNSKLRSAVKTDKNGWSAELAIPLSEFKATEFEGEFCAASRPGILYHLYRWGGQGREFGPAGTMRLGENADTLRIDSLGDPETGKLRISGFSSGKGKIEIKMDGEKPLKPNAVLGEFSTDAALNPGLQTLTFTAPGFLWSREILVRRPLNLTFDYKMKTGNLDVALDLSSADDEMKKSLEKSGLPIKIMLIDPSGKTRINRKVTVREIKNSITLKIPENLEEGTYQLMGKTGNVSASIPFRRPDLTPYKVKLGLDHTVPPPWTPVKQISYHIFEVWNRRYEFGNGPLPQQMIHGRDRLLKEPPVWSLNGKAVKWNDYRIEDVRPDSILLSGKGSADRIGITWRGELWFDGAYILRLRVAPDGMASIRDFGFRYAVIPDAGRYAMNPGYVRWKNGRVELQLGPGGNRKDNVLWLSGVEKGVCFWTESHANWAVAKDSAPLTAVRSSEKSTAQIQIIGREVKLTQPADYTFVFIATPSRPFPAEARTVNYGGFARNPYSTHQSVGWSQFHDRIGKDDPIYFNTPYPASPAGFRSVLDTYRKVNNIKLHYYTMPGTLSSAAPDSDYWSADLKVVPDESFNYNIKGTRFSAHRYCHLATDAPADYWTWTLERLMKDFPDMGGLYFDCCSTRFCSNSRHGCSGMDVFGQPYFKSDALGLRNFLMRVYKMHKIHPDKSMMLHSHIQYLPFCHNFTDYFAPGENTCEAVFRNPEYPYTEEVSPEEYQTEYNSRKAGVAFCMILQNARAAGIMPSLNHYRKRFLNEPEFAIRAITPFIVHDVNIWDAGVQRKTIIRFWKMRKDIRIDQVFRFIGYWENGCPVTSDSEKIYCSVYEWKKDAPWHYAVAVGNFTRQEKEIGLKIDWNVLGIQPPQSVRELWSGKDVPVSELRNFKLHGGHFALFGIK